MFSMLKLIFFVILWFLFNIFFMIHNNALELSFVSECVNFPFSLSSSFLLWFLFEISLRNRFLLLFWLVAIQMPLLIIFPSCLIFCLFFQILLFSDCILFLQESEIYQKCIRPPPNRTVFDGESPPPYRSSSAGLLSLGSTSSGSSSDWTHSVVRCHSMSSKWV